MIAVNFENKATTIQLVLKYYSNSPHLRCIGARAKLTLCTPPAVSKCKLYAGKLYKPGGSILYCTVARRRTYAFLGTLLHWIPIKWAVVVPYTKWSYNKTENGKTNLKL